MKEKIYCHWLPIAIGIMSVGVICDAGVELTDFVLFVVSESYMDYLFAAIVSVGLLSFSLIALVSGLLQEKFYGYKLSELLVFKGIKKRINLRKYIIVSLLQVILGILYLSLFFRVSCVNSMISLLVSAVFSAGCMAYSIFDIMVNNQEVYRILEEDYENLLTKDISKKKRYSYHVNTLTNAITEATKSGNLEETEEICSLYAVLLQMLDKDKTIEWERRSFFSAQLNEACCKISETFGYSKMIQMGTKMFQKVSDHDYWKTDLYLQPILDLKYYDDKQLEKCDYRNQVLEISVLKEYKEGIITEREWEKILYEYFLSLIKNKYCTEQTKYEMLNKFLAELLNFSGSSEENTLLTEEKIALYILNYIVNLENSDEQRSLYIMWLRNIAVHNQYSKCKHYGLFLSIVFQVLYSYAYLETEVRTEEYRKNVRQLVEIEVSDNVINGLKASTVFGINIEKVVESFGYRIPKDLSIVNSFEAYADFMKVKCKIWTEEYNIKFLFMTYCVYFDQVGFYGITAFLRWAEYTNDTKDKILKNFREYFEKDSGLLQENFVSECRQLGELYNHNYIMSEVEQTRVYDFIQEKQRELVDIKLLEEEVCEEGQLDTREIKKHLDNIMIRNDTYGWKPEKKMEFYIKYSDIKTIMHYENSSNIEHERTIANIIESYGCDAINYFIKSKCPKIVPSYDMEGIKRVLKCICDNDFSIRNFSYASVMTLEKYSKTEAYKILKEKENAIELCRMNFIHEDIYAKKDSFYFKLVPAKARMRYLNENECLEYLEKFGRYKEYYYVDGVLLDRNKAIECIKRKYFMYEMDFKLYIDFKPEDIMWFCYRECEL